MAKPVNPYTRLKEEARIWASSVTYPIVRSMFRYPNAADPNISYTLSNLHQRVAAADQLGYDVKLFTEGDALVVKYVKRPDDLPYSLKY